MADSNSKISAGVAKMQAESKGVKTPKFTGLAGKPVGVRDLAKMRNEIFKRMARLRALREKTVSAMAARERAIREKYSNEGFVTGDNGARSDILGATKRRALIQRAVAAAQKEVVARVSDEVSEQLAALDAAKSDLASARDAWASPVSVLMRSTLASPSRATYTANLANAGPVELADAAFAAIRNGDQPLAAAVLARVDRLPAALKKSLAFTKTDVAEALVSEDVAEAVEHIALSDLAVLLGEQEGREATGGKLTPADTLARGSMQARVAAEIGRDLTMADLAPVEIAATPTETSEPEPVEEPESDFDRWRAMTPLSDEWRALGLENGWIEESAA